MRRFVIWSGRVLAVVLGLALLGAVYESVSEAADARAYPPPGQMVDVGGYRLHLNCLGTGSPTVVIESGLGDWSASWNNSVQPQVARTTRVCTYDRAGMGYSEPGPLPRTAARFSEELHTLLQRADISGPYVLAGHSSGGFTVRVFAAAYPAEVVGLVLIDSTTPGPGAQAEAPTSTGWLSIATLPARVGLPRLLAGPLDLKGGLAPEIGNAYVARSVTPRSAQAGLDEFVGLSQGAAEAAAVTSLGELPLIVLSRAPNRDLEWDRKQTDLLRLSSNSQHLFADRSGHNIQFDQPEAAVNAMVQMVEQVRGQ
ncbi:MAG TPA: alpha/beta hydrolase [Chloroflexota bacterium]|jgi:pimeloyl-ACP methyl ester carboxylesterase